MTNNMANPDDRRQYLRMKINAQAELCTPDSTTILVICNDLSAGGAQIQLDKSLDENIRYRFVLKPKHPNGQPLHATAKIIWRSCLTENGKSQYRYGLKFSDIS